jgi:guanine deaminase
MPANRLVISGQLMLPAPCSRVRIAPGTVTIENGVIRDVHEGEPHPSPDLGGSNALILPGFVDAHMHLPQFDSIGIDGLTLLDWLDRAIFPAECDWADADHAGQMSTRAARSLLSFGTTSICAYATVHHDATRAAIAAIAASGMRAMVGQVLMDRNAPPELCRPAPQLIREAGELTKFARSVAASSGARIEHSINPRFAISCTPELLASAGKLARTRNAPVQTHISENTSECAMISQLFGGHSYARVYQMAGLLGPRTILAHGVWLGRAELRTLGDASSIVAHCPTANTFLQSGDCNVGWLRSAGIPIVVGSDIAGGSERSMVRVARSMIETSKRIHASDPGSPLISPAEAWWSISGGNADALGWPSTSRLAVGAEADILVVQPDIPWKTAADPLGTLLYAWDDRWITNTLLMGAPAFG